MIEKKTIMKARGKEGEQINAEHELQHLCEVFHETAMTVWNVDEESVKMSLPYHFTDGAPAMISARMMLDGKVRVSDDHLIAMHEPLTPSKIREICKEQGLDYSLRDFEMYTVVDKKAFWKIIGAIVHAHDIAMER